MFYQINDQDSTKNSEFIKLYAIAPLAIPIRHHELIQYLYGDVAH